MRTNRLLSDDWLYWNAERLEEFPHGDRNDYAGAAPEADDANEETESRMLSLLEDFLLYVAGVSAAMVGVGFAVLIGSFISAYSALNSPGAMVRAQAAPQAYSRQDPEIALEPAAARGSTLIRPDAGSGGRIHPAGAIAAGEGARPS